MIRDFYYATGRGARSVDLAPSAFGIVRCEFWCVDWSCDKVANADGAETTDPRFDVELTYEAATTHPRSTRPPLDEHNLQTLVETIPTPVWRARPDGDIDYVNKRLLEYVGSPLEKIIGWGWMEKVHPDDIAFKGQSWLSNLEAMTSHDANCRFQGADGAYRWFNMRGEPLRDSGGRVQNWYGVLVDIDNQKKAEDDTP